jgi:predicted peptidase
LRARAAGLPALLLLAGCAACHTAHPPLAAAKIFLPRQVTVDGRTYGYRVFLPPRHDRLRRWPVLLFLHGSGGRGDDNVLQTVDGIGPLLERSPRRFPFVVVLPQCREGEEWFGAMERQALAALDQTVREWNGDPARIYLTGISMGGEGAWYFARHRGRFAAVVPVAGEVVAEDDEPLPDLPADVRRLRYAADPYTALARAIGPTPVWAFHGADDDLVPVSESRRIVTALRALAGRVRYTEFAATGHACWDRAYAERGLVRWLLAQHLPPAAPPAATGP